VEEIMKRLPQGEELRKLVEYLGVSTHQSGLEKGGGENEAILQARVLAFLRERRDSKTWINRFSFCHCFSSECLGSMVRHPMGDEVKLHEKAGWHSLAQFNGTGGKQRR